MKILFMLLLACFVCEIQAQVITYDYAARQYLSADTRCVQHGTMVSYKLVNINTVAQKVVINGSVVSVTTQMPAQLATLFGIKVEAEKELANTTVQVEKMNNVKENVSGNLEDEMEKLVDSCNEYYDEAEKIRDVLSFQEKLIQTMADKNFNNEVKMKSELAARGITEVTIDDLEDNFEEFEAAYKKVRSQYDKAEKAALDSNEKDKAARILSAKQQIGKDYNALEDQYRKTRINITGLFRQAINPDTYVAQSQPIKLAGSAGGGGADEVVFDIKIDDSNKNDSGFPDVFNVRGGAKIDFSIGPVANFISDDKYFFDKDRICSLNCVSGV